MNELKQHIREEWTPRPGKQLLKDFLGIIVLIVTAWLGFNVHWIVAVTFFLGCFIISVKADQPRKIKE